MCGGVTYKGVAPKLGSTWGPDPKGVAVLALGSATFICAYGKEFTLVPLEAQKEENCVEM